jgi:hypothetical protein
MGVTYLSEIFTTNGKEISRDTWEGARARHLPLLWPFQPKPDPGSFRALRRLVADAFLEGKHDQVELRTRDLILSNPVRDWSAFLGWLQSKWTSFYSCSSQVVFILDPILHHYNVHSQKRCSRWTRTDRNSLHHTSPSHTTASLPTDAIPIDAILSNTVLYFPSVAHVQPLVQQRGSSTRSTLGICVKGGREGCKIQCSECVV